MYFVGERTAEQCNYAAPRGGRVAGAGCATRGGDECDCNGRGRFGVCPMSNNTELHWMITITLVFALLA